MVLADTRDDEKIIERIATLDIGKAEVTCCVRVPDPGGSGKRLQEVQEYSTMTRSLLRLCDRLQDLGATRVIMESTSVIRGLIMGTRTLPKWIRGRRVRDRSTPPGHPEDHARRCATGALPRRRAAWVARKNAWKRSPWGAPRVLPLPLAFVTDGPG
jgi:hypothetical protein